MSVKILHISLCFIAYLVKESTYRSGKQTKKQTKPQKKKQIVLDVNLVVHCELIFLLGEEWGGLVYDVTEIPVS